jgi:hypothetical protein
MYKDEWNSEFISEESQDRISKEEMLFCSASMWVAELILRTSLSGNL